MPFYRLESEAELDEAVHKLIVAVDALSSEVEQLCGTWARLLEDVGKLESETKLIFDFLMPSEELEFLFGLNRSRVEYVSSSLDRDPPSIGRQDIPLGLLELGAGSVRDPSRDVEHEVQRLYDLLLETTPPELENDLELTDFSDLFFESVFIDPGNFGSADAERRRMAQYTEKSSQYPDSNQLFIGNVPVTASEPELRDLFGKFGPIVDLRILSKGNTKSSGLRVPNYGFVIFEDQNAVQAVLNSKPIMFPNENGTKLNVEEKKAKRGGEGGRGGPRGGGVMRSGGGPMGGPSRGGPSGGPSRGGGGMRGFNGPNSVRRGN